MNSVICGCKKRDCMFKEIEHADTEKFKEQTMK